MHLKMNNYTGVHLKTNASLFIKIKTISKEIAKIANIIYFLKAVFRFFK